MNRINASLIQSLLAKNISFCLYRFPFGQEVRLAIEKEFLDTQPKKCFWIAPFVNISSARDMVFYRISNENEIESLIQKIQRMPDADLTWQQLPEQVSHEVYLNRMNTFLKEIRSGNIQKAVLSRVRKIRKPVDFDPYQVFKKLCDRYPEAFIHLVYNVDGGMWIGATPELLLARKDNCFTTMALAGTQPSNDLHDYTWQEKEYEEQLMVAQHVESVFSKYSFRLSKKNGPHTVEAGPVAHLRTGYEFSNKNSPELKSFLKDLHPTPAVGGLPSGDAVEFILENEGYDRKYYCGFLGETDFENDAGLYINLRCMQIGKDEIAIYCGGGITADSDPESEWNETVQKSRALLDILKERNEVV